MLTIGQLAAYVGVTVRAVRHYHKRGLLPEPDRDASGYRRYGADAVVDLIRIKTLSDAGVPLARIKELLDAEPGQFSQAIAQIDEALARRIRDLSDHRRRLSELIAGDRLFLPAEIAGYLGQLRDLGVSPRAVQMEREGWILLTARLPARVAGWAKIKQSALGDPEFRRLYLAVDEAFDWDPADPRLEELADAMVAFTARQNPGSGRLESTWTVDDPVAVALLSSQSRHYSPSWERLNQLCADKFQAASRS